jgi:hypothetical protein
MLDVTKVGTVQPGGTVGTEGRRSLEQRFRFNTVDLTDDGSLAGWGIPSEEQSWGNDEVRHIESDIYGTPKLRCSI